MAENKHSPCCGQNDNLSEPHCECGKEYIRTGDVPECRHTHNKSESIRRKENYNTFDIDNKLIINLRNLGHTMRFLFEGKGSQKRVLIILYETGGITQRELTERMGIQPGSASEVIGKLEKAGLIERKSSQADRRTVDIQLTEAGRKEAEEAALQRKIRHREMFSCLSDDEKAALLSLTEKINSDWDSRYSEKTGHHGIHGGRRLHGRHPGHHDDF